MPELTAHPSREQLSAYNLGQLPPDEAVAVESHISECEPCCDTIISLSSDDTFVGLLKEARQLPTDQTVDHAAATESSSCQDVPVQLAEHPRYEILGLIGKGGMGDVYKARHRKMERTVALKVINRGLVRKAEAIDRFHREVKAAAQLSHPNIVTAHDADQAGDFHFMVMEYVDGVDLSQKVKDRGALPIAEACDYIRQAAIGLQHAHECGMVHRDIKPHNLMVTSDGTVKILDFGLASLAPEMLASAEAAEARSDLTAAGAIMGTPDFISPEQAKDARQADIRSDIYSLGSTLYFLLSAQPPFAEGSVMHKLKSHAQSDPKPLDTVRIDVPADLAAVIKTMMAKDPDERFQTPEELAEALKPFSQSAEPRKIVEPPTQAKSRRWPPKFLSLTAVAALLVAAIFAGFVFFLQTGDGVLRVQRVPPEDRSTIGTHPLTIIDTSGKKPLGGTSRTYRDDPAGMTTHSFESANGRYRITLVDEVLTVNGEKYTLENPTDSIRIVDDRVEITRVVERPQESAQLRPNVNVASYNAENGHHWQLTAQKVDAVRIRLLHIANGKLEVASESVLRNSGNPNSTINLTLLQIPVDGEPESITTTIKVDANGMISTGSKSSPLTLAGNFHVTDVCKDGGLAWDEPTILFHLADFSGNLTYGRNPESMIEASKENARFVVLAVEWVAEGELEVPEWFAKKQPASNQDSSSVEVRLESPDDFERTTAKWVLDNGGVVVLKNTAGRFERIETVDDLPARQFTITHIGLKDLETLIDEDLKRLEGLHLSTLTLTGTQVTDAGLAYLKRVPQLDYLVLNQCPRITLSDVSGIRHVKALSLRDSPAISEDALKQLEALPNLSQLDIGENRQLTDQALSHVAKLKQLTLLALDSTDVSDAGLQHLTPLDELYTLNLASTAITDAGLKHLPALDALFDLNLASTAISDDGLKHVASLDLYALNLDSTAVSNAGLKHLASHDGLRKLSLNGTGVTAQGVEELREDLSEECQIDWESRADDAAKQTGQTDKARTDKSADYFLEENEEHPGYVARVYAWTRDIARFETELRRLAEKAEVPERSTFEERLVGEAGGLEVITDGYGGVVDFNAAKGTVQYEATEKFADKHIEWEFELASGTEIFWNKSTTLIPKLATTAEREGDKVGAPIFKISIAESNAGPFRAGDRVKVKATINDFSRFKKDFHRATGLVAVYYLEDAPNPFFWLKLDDADVTLIKSSTDNAAK